MSTTAEPVAETTTFATAFSTAPTNSNSSLLNAAAAAAAIAELQLQVTELSSNLDSFFLVMNGIIIFIMNMGFTFLEVGATRGKHCLHTMLINFADSGLTCIAYWLVGFGFAFGYGNSFIGLDYFAVWDITPTSPKWSLWFFQYTFACATASIVSGSVMERLSFAPFAMFTLYLVAIIYAIESHWVWHPQGWLAAGFNVNGEQVTYIDFAGSSVVHVCGGASAFVAAVISGPRIEKKNPVTGKPRELTYHDMPMMCMGAFLLMFGFLSFNGGSQGHISHPNDGAGSAMAVTNTIICGSSAGLTALLLSRLGYFSNGRWSLMKCMNGVLVGMVAICSGCAYVWPYGAFCIGVISAFAYMTWSKAVSAAGVDDPIEATAVHFGGGSWGTISVAFFHNTAGILYGGSGYILAWQLCGCICIALWSALLTAIYFLVCKWLKILRAPPAEEERGLDWPTCGEVAYPFNANGDGWVVGVDSHGNVVTIDDFRLSGMQASQLDAENPHFEGPSLRPNAAGRSIGNQEDANQQNNDFIATL